MTIAMLFGFLYTRLRAVALAAIELHPSEPLERFLSGERQRGEALVHDLTRVAESTEALPLPLWKAYAWRSAHRAAAKYVAMEVWPDRIPRDEALVSAIAHAALASEIAPLSPTEAAQIGAEVIDGGAYTRPPRELEPHVRRDDGWLVLMWGPVAP